MKGIVYTLAPVRPSPWMEETEANSELVSNRFLMHIRYPYNP